MQVLGNGKLAQPQALVFQALVPLDDLAVRQLDAVVPAQAAESLDLFLRLSGMPSVARFHAGSFCIPTLARRLATPAV